MTVIATTTTTATTTTAAAAAITMKFAKETFITEPAPAAARDAGKDLVRR